MTTASPAPTSDELLRSLAHALGHPKDKPVTIGSVESMVDTWMRAMAMIGRHVGAPDPRDPMGVAAAVEDRVAGRPIPPRAPPPALAVTPAPAPPLVPAPAAPPAQLVVTTTAGARAIVEGGQLYVELAGVRMRVTGVDLAP